MPRATHNPQTEELYHIAGDVPPEEAARDKQGAYKGSSTIDLTSGVVARPQIRYSGRFGEYVLTADVYPPKDGVWMIHIICPACSTPEASHGLSIKSDQKWMDWDPERGLSVEPFECTWEASPERRQFGLNRCGFRVAIDENRARDV